MKTRKKTGPVGEEPPLQQCTEKKIQARQPAQETPRTLAHAQRAELTWAGNTATRAGACTVARPARIAAEASEHSEFFFFFWCEPGFEPRLVGTTTTRHTT